jgi:hypothetical protein
VEDKYKHLIGKSHDEYNCWEIVKEFYKVCFDCELKQYYEVAPKDKEHRGDIIASNMGDIFKVDDSPRFGDIIIIKVMDIPCHIAVYLGRGRMLHSTASKGCVIEKVSRHDKVIEGFYRFK